MTMIDRITNVINKGIANRIPSREIAKSVIIALREPDKIDPKILDVLMKYVFNAGSNKAWDAALDQIIDPD